MEFEFLINETAVLISASSPETNLVISKQNIQWEAPRNTCVKVAPGRRWKIGGVVRVSSLSL